MKIAQIAPIVARVPPKAYGGSERIVSFLTEELVKRGHDVTLFASGDSITSANLVSFFPICLRDDADYEDLYGANLRTLLHIGGAYQRQDEFDIIHDHVVPLSLPTANLASTPVIATLHTRFRSEKLRVFQMLRKPAVVAVSKSHAKSAERINLIGTVHNGLVTPDYPFRESSGDYLLCVGSISLNKGTHVAIEVAHTLRKQLVIAAKLDVMDKPYFEEYVRPHLTDRIHWIGEVDGEERNRLMGNSRCFLHTTTWEEPFGLVLTEAMACGTPVVAYARGAVPEVIDDGVTGFVINPSDEDIRGDFIVKKTGIEGLCEAVERVYALSSDTYLAMRRACRLRVERNFTVEKMVDQYELLYQKLLKK